MNSRSSIFRSFLLIAACTLSMVSMAQKEKPKTLLYKDRVNAAFDTVNCVKNVFKINPLLFFRGEIPLYYERALTPRLSLEVGIGVTYRNFLALSIAGDDADDYGRGVEIQANPSFHIGGRYYHQIDIEPQGWYSQLEFAHLEYSKKILHKDSLGRFPEDPQRSLDVRTYNDLRLYIGYQLFSSSSNWMCDIYGGVAMRSRHSVKVIEETRVDFTNSRVEYLYSTIESDDTVPAFFLGFKVGLGF